MKFPLIKSISASFVYFLSHFLTLVKVLWLPTLLMMAVTVYVMPSMMDAQVRLYESDEASDPMAAFQAMGPLMGSMGLFYLAMAIFYPMMIAGVLRHVVRGESPGLPFYLRFAGDELRILGAVIVLILLYAILYIAGFLAVMALGLGLSAVAPAIGGVVTFLLIIALVCVMIWFMVRLSIVFAAGVGARTLGVAVSWRTTKGAFWGLFAYWIFWFVVTFLLALAYMAAVSAGYLALFQEMFGAAQDPAAIKEIERRMIEMQRDLWDLSKPGAWGYVVATYAYTLISTAIWSIAGGVAYRYLTDRQ